MDNKRIDLNKNCSSIHEDSFLKDLEAAQNQVVKRKADDKAKAERTERRKESTKIQTLIIACAALVLVVLAYFVVFAKPDTPEPITRTVVTAPERPVTAQPSSSVSRSRQSTSGQDSERRQRAPRHGYEQPKDRGM